MSDSEDEVLLTAAILDVEQIEHQVCDYMHLLMQKQVSTDT